MKMKYRVGIAAVIVVMVLAAWLAKAPDSGCAEVTSDSMGIHFKAQPGTKMALDTSCKSGASWAKP